MRTLSYSDQMAKIFEDAFGWSNSWSSALTPLGYECLEIASNAKQAQMSWAKEQGLGSLGNWQLDITEAQICKFQPDILFVDDYALFSKAWLDRVREKCPSIRLVLGWCGANFYDEEPFLAYDALLSNIPEICEHFSSKGHKSFHMYHAFDSRILNRLPQNVTPEFGISFAGQITRDGHRERESILLKILETEQLHLFCPDSARTLKGAFKVFVKKILWPVSKFFRRLGILEKVPEVFRHLNKLEWAEVQSLHPSFKKIWHPPVFGIEMYRVFQKSRIVLNNHINLSRVSANNMRMFEATGVGACLLVDHKERVGEIFEVDSEVVTYRSAEEAYEKARFLLQHPDQAKKIGLAGQARTLKDHTFNNRAEAFDKIIRSLLTDVSSHVQKRV